MAQPERSFRQSGYFSGAEFDYFQCTFVGHCAQDSGADKTGTRASERRDSCRGFGCHGKKFSASLGQLRDVVTKCRKIRKIRDALPGQNHVAE